MKSVLQFTRHRSYPYLRKSALLGLGALLAFVLLAVCFLFYGIMPNRWYQVLAVSSGSMSPTIETGDLIVITRPPERPETGMVLTMRVAGEVVTHRIVQINPDGSFLSRGDANPSYDQWEGYDVSLVGQYRFRIPGMGALIQKITGRNLANQTYGWFQDVDQVGFTVFILEDAKKADISPVVEATPTLTVAPTPTSPAASIWDESQLSFGMQGYNCTGGGVVWAVLQNTGQPMTGPVNWELYNDQPTLVTAGEIPQLSTGQFSTIQAAVSTSGKYSFRVLQRPGFPENPEIWSPVIEFNTQECAAAPDPVAPPTATLVPTETQIVEPIPTDPPVVPSPTPSPEPTTTPVPTETPAPQPEEIPTEENTPLPQVPLPSPTEPEPVEATPESEG